MGLASGVVSGDDLQRHERSPIAMGRNFAYRSVFEKGFETLCFDPEAAALVEEVALAGCVGVLVDDEGTTDFAAVAATRFIAARPLAEI